MAATLDGSQLETSLRPSRVDTNRLDRPDGASELRSDPSANKFTGRKGGSRHAGNGRVVRANMISRRGEPAANSRDTSNVF